VQPNCYRITENTCKLHLNYKLQNTQGLYIKTNYKLDETYLNYVIQQRFWLL